MYSLLCFSIENKRTLSKGKRGHGRDRGGVMRETVRDRAGVGPGRSFGRRQKKSPGGISELLRGVHGEWRGQKRYSTIVGVTKITSSCFLSAMELDENNLPRNGMSLRNGTPRFTLV